MVKNLTPDQFFNLKKVFFVRSENDNSVLVAVNPKFDPINKIVSWWDTTKERNKNIIEINLGEGELSFLDTNNYKYTFVPLNLNLYRSLIMSKIIIPQNFTTEEDMIKAFEKQTSFN